MTIPEKVKKTILRSLTSYRSDDYERAKIAFSRFSSEEMQLQWGNSGFTRQQILDSYGEHVDVVNEAISWITSQPVKDENK